MDEHGRKLWKPLCGVNSGLSWTDGSAVKEYAIALVLDPDVVPSTHTVAQLGPLAASEVTTHAHGV